MLGGVVDAGQAVQVPVWAWRCTDCGWVGSGLASKGAADVEAARHQCGRHLADTKEEQSMSCRRCETEAVATYVRVENGNVQIVGCRPHLADLVGRLRRDRLEHPGPWADVSTQEDSHA